LPAGGDAPVDHVEVAGVAVPVPHVAPRAAVVRVVGGVRALVGLLGAFPRGPRLAFHAVDLLDLDLAGQVEVAHRLMAPRLLDLLEVVADRRLFDAHFPRDGGLRPALEIQVSDPPAADVDAEGFTDADVHSIRFPWDLSAAGRVW
jgi:hypothetical protein